MGKASSSKKVARAARASGRPGSTRSYTWPAIIGAVVVLGILGIVVSLGGNDDDPTGPPRPNEDHWHAAYGVYICGSFVPAFGDAAGDKEGIHTHEDGLMHIHPFFTRVSGRNANIEAFARDVGLELADDKVSGPGFPSKENGDKCGSKAGEWRLVTWGKPSAEPKTRTTNFGAFAPKDQSVWVLAFVPKGVDEVPQPPSVANLQDPTAAEEGREPVVSGDATTTTSSVPSEDSTTSSSVPADESTTSSSAPPDTSSTTSSSTP